MQEEMASRGPHQNRGTPAQSPPAFSVSTLCTADGQGVLHRDLPGAVQAPPGTRQPGPAFSAPDSAPFRPFGHTASTRSAVNGITRARAPRISTTPSRRANRSSSALQCPTCRVDVARLERLPAHDGSGAPKRRSSLRSWRRTSACAGCSSRRARVRRSACCTAPRARSGRARPRRPYRHRL